MSACMLLKEEQHYIPCLLLRQKTFQVYLPSFISHKKYLKFYFNKWYCFQLEVLHSEILSISYY